MFTRIDVTYRGPVPGSAQFGATEWREMFRAAWEQVGFFWHERFRPKHFTRAGARQYGYPAAAKNVRYEFIKLRKMGLEPARQNLGYTRPLVYTGDSETLSQIRDVRPTSGGVKIVLQGKGISFWATRIGAISAAEAQELAAVHGRVMAAQIGAVQGSETKTF